MEQAVALQSFDFLCGYGLTGLLAVNEIYFVKILEVKKVQH